jgi:hypothetical protein
VRKRRRAGVAQPDVERNPVRFRIPPRHRDRRRVQIDGHDGAEAELGAGDRDDARAAADVEQRPGRQRGQEAEAEARRRVRAGAEGASRLDHDRRQPGRRPFPRGPDPQRSDDHRLVEAPPRVLPARLERRREELREPAPRPLLGRAAAVGDELDVPPEVTFLETTREERQPRSASLLRPRVGQGDGETA